MQPTFASVEKKQGELAALRPLAGGTLEVLRAWYDVELTYTSNALEGNTLTRSETAIVLEKGVTVAGRPLRDHLEAAGHKMLSIISARWQTGLNLSASLIFAIFIA